MREYGFSLTRILPYKNRIVGSVLIRENTGQWKPVFSNILCSLNILKFIIVKTGSALKLLLLPKRLFRVICVFFVPLLEWGRKLVRISGLSLFLEILKTSILLRWIIGDNISRAIASLFFTIETWKHLKRSV